MAISWTEQTKCFKSRLPVVASFLLKSRETQIAKRRGLREECTELKRQLELKTRQLIQHEQEVRELRYQIEKLEVSQSAPKAPTLCEDPPVGTHGFGPRMIELAVNLARKVGLRGAANAIKIFFKWIGVSQKTPNWTTIRSWLQRIGIAKIKEPVTVADDWIWMADHSNQIGKEKTLVCLGIRASSLPEPGKTLTHQDVRVMTVQPGVEWKQEDMANVYEQMAKQYGAPRAVLVDGATELRNGAKCLEKYRSDTIVLRDFKHYAANVFKSLIGNDPQFKEFGKNLGITRSAIQQTELAHLGPPKPKPKARFMNLKAILRWGTVVSWVLNDPKAESRKGIAAERLEEKLGWVRKFNEDLVVWQECQNVLSFALKFINKHGLSQGASAALRTTIGSIPVHDKGKQMAERLIQFVDDAEQHLAPGERLPMSTEILESSFSLFKQLERQHCKGGFTSLLATFAALLKPTTHEEITDALTQVSNKDVKAWVKQNLGSTLMSRRKATYREHAQTTKSATIQLTTT